MMDDLIQNFFFLQPEGVPFTIGGKVENFQGALAAFTGDTPAIHQLAGFKEGVSFALRICRHCMATSEQSQTKVYFP